MKKALCIILTLICLGLFSYGGYRLYLELNEYTVGEEAYKDLSEHVSTPSPTPQQTPVPDHASPNEEELPDIAWPEVDFAALREINPDIVGWLYCEDTVINYPVVQGEDNSYYLKHLFDGTYNANGCLFLDCRVSEDLMERHSIIYGHHMKNGSMLSSIDGYKRQEYYDAHPQLLLMTPERNYIITLFAGYVASVNDRSWDLAFANELEFEEWIISAIERGCFDSEIIPLPTDRIITLSTCSYEFNDARFVVLGVLSEV